LYFDFDCVRQAGMHEGRLSLSTISFSQWRSHGWEGLGVNLPPLWQTWRYIYLHL